MAPTRAGLVVVTSAAAVVAAGLFALGALRPSRATSARPEIAHLVDTRRLALMQAAAASAEPLPPPPPAAAVEPSTMPPFASEAEPPVAPAMPSGSAGKRTLWGKRYRKFDP
jgi:hypothetical protein